ncbi:MAG: holo-ACP synthase [bacterium]
MIHSIGTDIIEVKRIKNAVKKNKNFVNKIFTDSEIEYCRKKKNFYINYAGRFAAKEAIAKLFGKNIRPVIYKEIEIKNGANGEPKTSLSGGTKLLAKRLGFKKFLISISHTENYAVAMALGERSCSKGL